MQAGFRGIPGLSGGFYCASVASALPSWYEYMHPIILLAWTLLIDSPQTQISDDIYGKPQITFSLTTDRMLTQIAEAKNKHSKTVRLLLSAGTRIEQA